MFNIKQRHEQTGYECYLIATTTAHTHVYTYIQMYAYMCVRQSDAADASLTT